jgi:iron complex outermembrane receptor protein
VNSIDCVRTTNNQTAPNPTDPSQKIRSGKNRLLAAACLAALSTQPYLACAADEADAESESRSKGTLDEVVVESQRDRSTVGLDNVANTGSRLGIETRDLPASVSVVSQELIQLQGARNSIEAIGSAVGMTGGTSVGSIPSFATRGFTSNDITVMRDGIRQNTASQSSRPLDSFLFDRIEVLKGPASLLYGEGAVGGAINYVSKLPTPMFQGEGFASIGPWNTYRFGAGAGGPTGVDSLSYRIDASQSSSDGYVDRSDYDYTAIAGALRWDVSETSSLTLSSTYLKDETSSYYGTPVVYDAVIDQNGTQIVRKANTTTDRLVNARIVSGTETNNYNILDNFANAENTFSRLIWEQ